MNQEPLQMESCKPPATKAFGVAAPKNRVGGSPVFSFVFTFQYIGQTLDTPAENGGCGYDFASGVHKYLYAGDNPVNLDDPSGNDYGDFSIKISSIFSQVQSIAFQMVAQTVDSLTDNAKTLVDVYIWRGQPLAPILGNSVGHVMLTVHNTEIALLSQFPFKTPDLNPNHEGIKNPLSLFNWKGYNGTATYDQTMNYEKRAPDNIFMVQVPDVSDFGNSVALQRTQVYWDWSPDAVQTQCSTSVYNALKDGGVNFSPFDENYQSHGGTGKLMPTTFDRWMLGLAFPPYGDRGITELYP